MVNAISVFLPSETYRETQENAAMLYANTGLPSARSMKRYGRLGLMLYTITTAHNLTGDTARLLTPDNRCVPFPHFSTADPTVPKEKLTVSSIHERLHQMALANKEITGVRLNDQMSHGLELANFFMSEGCEPFNPLKIWRIPDSLVTITVLTGDFHDSARVEQERLAESVVSQLHQAQLAA